MEPPVQEENNMNKTELIAAVAEKAGMSKKDAETAIVAVVDSITEALAMKKTMDLKLDKISKTISR